MWGCEVWDVGGMWGVGGVECGVWNGGAASAAMLHQRRYPNLPSSPQQNRRNIIPRTPTQRLEHQVIDTLLRSDIRPRNDLTNPLVVDLVGQPIRTQQQPRPRRKLAACQADVQLLG